MTHISTIKCAKLGGKFFGPVKTGNLQFAFCIYENILDKMAKIKVDSKYDFCPLSFKTKFSFLHRMNTLEDMGT